MNSADKAHSEIQPPPRTVLADEFRRAGQAEENSISANDMSASSAVQSRGRWNSIGTPMGYCSSLRRLRKWIYEDHFF